MRKKFFACFAAALMSVTLTAGVSFAKTIEGPDGNVEIELPDDFYTMYIDDSENNELTNHLDITYDTVKSYMEENDIYVDGVNEDGSIEIYAVISNLGQDYGSMSDYPDDTLDDFLEGHKKSLEERKCTNITTERLDDNFYMITYDAKNDIDTYHVISYSTFSGEYIYTLNVQYTNIEDYETAKAYLDKTKDTLKAPQAEKRSGFISPAKWKIQWLIISLTAVMIIAAAIVIIASRKKN